MNGLITINLARVHFEENDNVFASDSTKFQFFCTPYIVICYRYHLSAKRKLM